MDRLEEIQRVKAVALSLGTPDGLRDFALHRGYSLDEATAAFKTFAADGYYRSACGHAWGDEPDFRPEWVDRAGVPDAVDEKD